MSKRMNRKELRELIEDMVLESVHCDDENIPARADEAAAHYDAELTDEQREYVHQTVHAVFDYIEDNLREFINTSDIEKVAEA